MENICNTCKFHTENGRCNRLVFTCIGMNDRIGSDYKKGNYCDYHEEGNTNKDRVVQPMNFFNS